MKKTILFILASILTFTTAYIVFGFIFELKCSEPNHKPRITVENDEIIQREIAYKLMDERLKSFKSSAVNKQERIKDYKIYSVHIHSQVNSGFVFTIDYSVKPTIIESGWRAGNGAYNEKSGWIESKFLFVRVLQEGNTFTYVEGATGGFADNVFYTPRQVIEEHFMWQNKKSISKTEELLTERRRGIGWNFDNLKYIKLLTVSSEKRENWVKHCRKWAERDGLSPENAMILLVEFEVKFVNDLHSCYPSGKYKWHYYLIRKNENSPWLIDDWAVY